MPDAQCNKYNANNKKTGNDDRRNDIVNNAINNGPKEGDTDDLYEK